MNSSDIKTLIETSQVPLLFNNFLKWKLLDWDLSKWNECLGNTKLQFRMGTKSFSQDPQWEKTCEIVKGTFEDFRNFNEDNKWLYFDYKYLNQWFIDKFDLRNEVSWENFGFDKIKAEESTIWIGGEGAHTPCHVDTYGFNLVAQITGRKLWLLFAPETDLKATRIPYEESTIYSSLNFYCPTESMIELLSKGTKCKLVILEPGQVLFVPNGWWHYVENLELSISINTWIPIKNDDKKRVSEGITLMMMKTLISDLKSEEQEGLVNNPHDVAELSIMDVLNIIENSLEKCKTTNSIPITSLNKDNCNNPSNISRVSEELFNTNDDIEEVPNLSPDKLQNFLKSQSQRFSDDKITETQNCFKNKPNVCLIKKYLSVLIDPEVLGLIERKLSEACKD